MSGFPALAPDEIRRYARHLTLPEVGPDGQKKLAGARVLCVGVGGLGSPLALYLAAAGVGRLGLVDPDRVELSNLQRQVLYGSDDVGRPKVEVAAERLRGANHHVEVVTHPVRLDAGNAPGILAGYDVVADGTDNFATRYLVNDACVRAGIPNVFASVLRWEGQLSVFVTPDGPCYRCIFPDPPPPGLVPDCAEGGVLGVLPGLLGSLQALEVVKWIVGAGRSMAGRLLLVDGLRMEFREVALGRNPGCPSCGPEGGSRPLAEVEIACGTGVREIDPRELRRRLRGPEAPLVVDVREEWEWKVGRLAPAHGEARLVPLADLPDGLQGVDPHRAVVTVCRSGGRSAAAVRLLERAGWTDVSNLKGGLRAWARDVDPGVEVA